MTDVLFIAGLVVAAAAATLGYQWYETRSLRKELDEYEDTDG